MRRNLFLPRWYQLLHRQKASVSQNGIQMLRNWYVKFLHMLIISVCGASTCEQKMMHLPVNRVIMTVRLHLSIVPAELTVQ